MELRIRELREEKGWNQTVLGYHAGLSPSQISLIETGKRNPSATTLQGIASALGVEVGDLFPKAQAPQSPSGVQERGAESPKGRDVAARKLLSRLATETEEDDALAMAEIVEHYALGLAKDKRANLSDAERDELFEWATNIMRVVLAVEPGRNLNAGEQPPRREKQVK